MSRPLVAVVAVGENGVIGAEGDLPWRLPTDLKHFKERTLGKPMIMGRKTFQSIGKPLPGRTTIILTRDETFAAEGCLVGHSVDDVIRLAEKAATDLGAAEITVVGGAEVYRAFMARLDRIEYTRVHTSPEGDARFPELGPEWRLVESHFAPKGEKDSADMTFEVFVRHKS